MQVQCAVLCTRPRTHEPYSCLPFQVLLHCCTQQKTALIVCAGFILWRCAFFLSSVTGMQIFDTAQVEGVGLGAIAAAAKMGSIDPLSMATWQAGDPVPFSFLVDTFDVRLLLAPPDHPQALNKPQPCSYPQCTPPFKQGLHIYAFLRCQPDLYIGAQFCCASYSVRPGHTQAMSLSDGQQRLLTNVLG